MAEGPSQGPATDRKNDPVEDPTANVRELFDAGMQRQDDLRRASEYHHREMAKLRDCHIKEMRKGEAERLDAIRAVDVAAVQQAAQVAQAQAVTLAAQVATTADAQRVALAAALEPVQKDIADLRKTQYEQAGGKLQVTEARAGGANTGMWVGVAVGSIAIFISIVAIVVMALQATP